MWQVKSKFVYSSTASTALSLRFMNETLDQQLDWVRADMKHLGVTANGLATRAGFRASTIQKPLNDPDWPHALSGTTLAKIARVAGVKPMEFPNRPTGSGEAEATAFVFGEVSDAIGSNIDRAVRELTRGRAGRDPWVLHSYALESSGYLPGDILIIDRNITPAPKDVVCAELYQWTGSKAETVFRLYEPPYLLTNSVRVGIQKPLLVDNDHVVIKGVVDGLVRPRHVAAA